MGDVVLYHSGAPSSGDFNADAVPEMPAPETADPSRTRLLGNLLIYSQQFRDASGQVIIIDSGQSYQFARLVQRQLATSLLVALPVLLLLAALAGYVLMRRALAPVEGMINAAETYTFNDPHKRLPTLVNEPRIEALGLALNRMLDRLDSAYSHVNRFSADAAHELRTPLTIIRGELELVSGEGLPEQVSDALASALDEITRLTGLVDSLITLSRMESLWGKRAHAPVNLRELATETLEQMNLLAEEKHIALIGPGEGAPATVIGDRDRLKQVLVNLLDNAIKYTPNKGKVTVATGIEDDRGIVTVEDTGIGIDPAHHEGVFERFYRVTPDRGEIGTGLGLAIVKSICHAHGGQVTLRSVPEFGSCFRIELPLAESKMATAQSAAAISPAKQDA
jgi:signal transduction histidine kinase